MMHVHFPFSTPRPLQLSSLVLPAFVALVALLIAPAREARGDGFEQPNPLRSAAYLAADQLAGPDFRVEPQATSDGLATTYTVTSRFGTWPAHGRMGVAMRIREIQALAALEEVSKSDVFLDAVKNSATAPLQLVQAVATKPAETLKGVPAGVGRWMKKTSFQVKEGYNDAKEVRADLKEGEEAGDSTTGTDKENLTEKGKEEATKYALGYLKISGAELKWYAKLGVDPYTDNEILRKAVTSVARVEGLTSFGMKFAGMPGIPGASEARKTLDLVWKTDPWELRLANRKKLLAAGLTEETARSFEDNPSMSLSQQTALLQTLDQLAGVHGRETVIARAIDLASREEASQLVVFTCTPVALPQAAGGARGVPRRNPSAGRPDQEGVAGRADPLRRPLLDGGGRRGLEGVRRDLRRRFGQGAADLGGWRGVAGLQERRRRSGLGGTRSLAAAGAGRRRRGGGRREVTLTDRERHRSRRAGRTLAAVVAAGRLALPFALALAGPLAAQPSASPATTPAAAVTAGVETTPAPAARPKIGIAFSGGGAKGCAHIGVMRVFEEMRIPIDYAAGTSMGSIIGGLYAAGLDPDELTEAILTVDWADALTDKPSRKDRSFRRKDDDLYYIPDLELGIGRKGLKYPTGLRSGQKLSLLLRRLTLPVRTVRGLRRAADPVPRRRDRHRDRPARWSSSTATSPAPCAPAWRFRPSSRRSRWTASSWSTAASPTTCRSTSSAPWAPTS